MRALSCAHALLLQLLCVAKCCLVSAFSARQFSFVHQRSSTSVILQAQNDETNDLLEKARRLREQAKDLEDTKREAQQLEQQQRDTIKKEEQQQRNEWKGRYSVVVPILKDMGEEVMERVDFAPRIKGGKSRIICTEAPLPLGIVLGQDNESGLITVDELAPDGNGAVVGMIREGDLLRAVTACQTTMETPTWQLLAGGIGQPKTKRFMFSVDGRPLEEVLNAVGSNRMDVAGRDVILVLERVE
jgi:GTP cyclohydrolase II